MGLFFYSLNPLRSEFFKKHFLVFFFLASLNTYGVSRRLPTMLQSRSGKPVSQCTNKSYQNFISSLRVLRGLSFAPPAGNHNQCLKIKNPLLTTNLQMREALHMMHQLTEDTWELKRLKKTKTSPERIQNLKENLQRAKKNNIYNQSLKKTEQFFKIFSQALKEKCFGSQNNAKLQDVLLSFSGMLDIFNPQTAATETSQKNQGSAKNLKALYTHTALSRALFDFDIKNYKTSDKNLSLKKALTCSLKKVTTECKKSNPSPASQAVCIDCLQQDLKQPEDQKIKALRELASLNPCQTHQQFFSRLSGQLRAMP